MSATGEFTTVWNDVWAPSCGATGEFVFGQTIDSTTRPLGGEFQIEVQRCPEISVGPSQAVWLRSDVAIDDAGNTVVIWNGGRIVGQFLDGSGAPVGAEFPISDVATTPVHEPSVATAGGDFLAVWIREDSPGSPLRVHGRRFDSDGVLLGDELVAPSAEGEQWTPAVAMNDRGDAVITWSGGKEFFKSDVFASLNKPGCPPSPVGPIFYVDQVRYGESLTLAVDGAGEGRELYQWYQDEEPVQSATSPRFTTEPLSRTTTFRVEVTSVCGTTTSETVTVSVGERRRGIRR